MTRIITGDFKGRRLQVPSGSQTRPTSERVREALFARIESIMDLQGARVLDLYAGSGALGLEALSRGAESLLQIETARQALLAARANRDVLGVQDEVTTLAGRVERLLAHNTDKHVCDLVLIDPPYRLSEEALASVLHTLLAQGWLGPDPLIVVERSRRSPAPDWPRGLRVLDERRYGETAVYFGERDEADDGTLET